MKNTLNMKKSLVFLLSVLSLCSCGGRFSRDTSLDNDSNIAKEEKNDTYHQALIENLKDVENAKQETRKREEAIRKEQQEKEEQRQNNEILNILQGSWVWSDDYYNMWSMLVFNGYDITEYNDGVLSDRYIIRNIDKEGRKIYYGRDNYLEFVVTNDGQLKLFGDKRKGIRFLKLSLQQEKAYARYNEDIRDWKRIYNEYLNVNPYGSYSRKQALDDLWSIIRQLHKDLDNMGRNDVCEKQVKELWRITDGLTPF